MAQTIRLVEIDGALYFPTGGNILPTDPDSASLLLRCYPAGDVDTCPWPMTATTTPETELRERLAIALFDERETNDTFPDDATIELPDGTTFDFDAELAEPRPTEGLARLMAEGFPLESAPTNPTDALAWGDELPDGIEADGFQLLPQPMAALRELIAWVDATGVVHNPVLAGMDTGPLDRARALVKAEDDGNLIG
jgi:hypothetical protein